MDKLMKSARKQLEVKQKEQKIQVVPLGGKRFSSKYGLPKKTQDDDSESSDSNFVIENELVSDFVDEEDKQMKILTQEKDQHVADDIIKRNNNDRSMMLFVQQ